MIEEIKKLEEDWYLIHLKDTRYYQIWNKWDLFKVLLDATTINLNEHPKPYLNLLDEDFPMQEEELKNIVNKLKENKEVWNKQKSV